MKSRKRDEIDSFKAWLTSRGAEVLVPTNEWEIVRFRGDGATSIIYNSKTGARTYTGRAKAAWDAFKGSDASFRLMTRPVLSQRTRKTVPIIATLIARDGDVCFYCGDPFQTIEARTREHLIPTTHGGPNHISNLFLACQRCNLEAGHLSASEKIRLREIKHGWIAQPAREES